MRALLISRLGHTAGMWNWVTCTLWRSFSPFLYKQLGMVTLSQKLLLFCCLNVCVQGLWYNYLTNKVWESTVPHSVVVSTLKCRLEALRFKSCQTCGIFLSSDHFLCKVRSAVGPVGRLGPYRWASSTSQIHLWGCSDYLTNSAGSYTKGGNSTWKTPQEHNWDLNAW